MGAVFGKRRYNRHGMWVEVAREEGGQARAYELQEPSPVYHEHMAGLQAARREAQAAVQAEADAALEARIEELLQRKLAGLGGQTGQVGRPDLPDRDVGVPI